MSRAQLLVEIGRLERLLEMQRGPNFISVHDSVLREVVAAARLELERRQ